MNLDRLNQWLMLAANVGVIAGFVLLAAQMKQNTEALALQNRNDAGHGGMTIDLGAMGDGVYATATTAILQPSSLTEAQVYQLYLYQDSVINVVWNTWNAYQAGEQTKDDWDGARAWVCHLFSYDAAKIIWNRVKRGYPPPFVQALDEEFARQGDEEHEDLQGMISDIRALAKPMQTGS